MKDNIEKLIEKALSGDRASVGRLLTYIERSPEVASKILSIIIQEKGGGHVIGVTGIPGSGKSTLISRLISHYKNDGSRVAVIAIDPTSPLSRGALLGDRIRMQEHATDPRVFIRSVPTRGVKGGLSFSGVAMIEVFDRLGFDKIIVESIGVGQTDIDIMNLAHTILVVTAPGLGDEIQALKAGIMEIGDIYVLNKSDKPEANRTYAYLDFALETGEIGSEKIRWKPRLVKTSAVLGQGIEDLVKVIEEHLEFIKESGIYQDKIMVRRRYMVRLLAEKLFLETLEELSIDIKPSGKNIYEEAVQLLREVLGQFN